jgi:diaminohydroxyphosphoribosylaminopyrimidine deaminase/5-amino-6-(5-phosphoribosylamino)uracil reductase
MWDGHMREALALAVVGPRSQNPQVGCVIVDDQGTVVGRGFHRGAGTPHAEVVALREAGERARGATAVVTLEPCRHVGRTGPCTEALHDAGIARVVFAQDDPTQQAAGGADQLREWGVDVHAGVLAAEAERVTRGWTALQRRGRPFLTLKCAMSLDGRVTDASGGPTPITGLQARAWAHEERARTDALIVGTGTALVDDPALTARRPDGSLAERQPLRVVVGLREVPAGARVRDGSAPTVFVRSHDPQDLVVALVEAGVQEGIVEGGPTLAATLIDAGLIDAVVWLVAPVLLGQGLAALPPLRERHRVSVNSVDMLGHDVRIEGTLNVHGDR